mmetsp:Transcript_40327/g.46266  ORF Transcript_40327/g.46266 Transcript_40327/m.46266 type:complete len:145 (-) Transcript_40327:34-468(-)
MMKKEKEAKQSTNKSLSSKSNSTNKDYSLSKKSSINNSITRKKKGKKFEIIGFSPKSNCEVAKLKSSKDMRNSISKGKKKLKVNSKKRKHRFIRRVGVRKAPNNGAATNQTTTIEDSSEEGSRVREVSLPNKTNNMLCNFDASG